MKRTFDDWVKIYFWLRIVSLVLLCLSLYLGLVLDNEMLFYILLACFVVLVLVSEFLHYEFWRCPKCDRRLPRDFYRMDSRVCPYCAYEIREVDEPEDKNLL